jgi:hypothetical protein
MFLATGPGARAQAPSPARDLLSIARARLNDLNYRHADSVASAVLDFPDLRRVDRIQALQILAGALYPEPAAAQQRNRAEETLRMLVRIAPSGGLPREVSWAGLDSLYRQVRATTFGASAAPRQTNLLVGPDDRASIDVAASRPASFRLTVRYPGQEAEIPLDTLVVTDQGVLRFQVLRGGRQQLRSGAVELKITAFDLSQPDSLQLRYDAVIDAPQLDLAPVPQGLDSSRILPEITSPRRAGGIVAGLLVAAGTIVAARVIRASSFRTAVPSDGRVVGLGLALGVTTGAGVWLLDKGAPIPKNIQANQELRHAFAEAVATTRAENDRRIAAYRAEIRINPEPR